MYARTVKAWGPHDIEKYLTSGEVGLSTGAATLYGRAAHRMESSGLDPVAWFQEQSGSAKLAKKTLGTMRSAAAYYMVWKQLVASYPEAVSRLGGIERGRGEKKRNALSEEEVVEFLQLADTLAGSIPMALRLMLCTGLRVSEACALDWDDVVITGRRPLVAVREGKGNNPRDVDLDADGVALLRALQGKRPRAGPVFEWEYTLQGGAFDDRPTEVGRLQPYVIRRELQAAREAAQTLQGVTPHVLRHTRATDLLDSGFALPYIRELLGHRSAEVINRYLHTRPNVMAAAMKNTPRRWAGEP